MKLTLRCCLVLLFVHATPSMALSFAPEEFQASRKLACVLAQQSLGQLSEDEYGERTHTLLDGFDEIERDNILAQALGYYGGLVFTTTSSDDTGVNLKLEDFLASSTCADGYSKVTLRL